MIRRLSRSDRVALLVLLIVPILGFAVPALFGHPVVPGDDATQNFPLRVLVGTQIGRGQLPLFDPYVWSGAPLLGGWNAGAAYPLTLLFAFLPGAAAWTLNLLAVCWVAGLGCYAFLRSSRLGSLPSFLGAVTFSFAGAMSAQVAHVGFVAGMSWVPLELLAVLRLSERRTPRARLAWSAVLGATGAMSILAGEPRAIDDTVVIVAIYALWRAIRLGRHCRPFVLSLVAGAGLAVGLGAVQWLPGALAVSSSQRATNGAALFTSGSLPPRWLLLLAVPNLLGGSGSFGQPQFLATYNLPEVTGYVGVMPLVAAFALLGRLRLRRPLPEWLVWHVVAVVGVVLALGGNTPLWHLLIRLPLFGDQRLQSRNIMIADLALAFLLAYWADRWLGSDGHRRHRPLTRSETIGVVAAAGTVVTAALALLWGAGFLRWLGYGIRTAKDHALKPWLAPYLVIGVLAIILVVAGRRLGPRWRGRALVGLVACDVGVFTLLVIVTLAPNLGQGAGAAGAGAVGASATKTNAAAPGPVTPLSTTGRFSTSGRFAVYDPDLVDYPQLLTLGAPDANVISGVASAEGYGSIVDGVYASTTGSHEATGLGQDVLSTSAIGNGTLDQLDTQVLVTLPNYLLVPPGSVPASGTTVPGQRELAAHQRATWYFGESLAVTTLAVPDPAAAADTDNGFELGLETTNGTVLWATTTTARRPGWIDASFAPAVEAVAVVAEAGGRRSGLGPPTISTAAGTAFTADGRLQNALVPPRWTFSDFDGPFAVFADRFALPPLTLRPLPNHSTTGASVRAAAGLETAPSVVAVSSPQGVEVVRAVAAIPGWGAVWHPADGASPTTLSIRRVGLVQAVDVPPGRGTVVWQYIPPGFVLGAGLSLGFLALSVGIALGSVIAATRRRRPLSNEQARR